MLLCRGETRLLAKMETIPKNNSAFSNALLKFCHSVLVTKGTNVTLFKILIQKCIKWVKKSLHYEIFVLVRYKILLRETY